MADKNSSAGKPRRQLANVNLLGTTQVHARNPYLVAFWSAMFPGFGHLLLSKYLRGYTLFIWEIIINISAHVNLALMYTFLGDFDRVRDVVDIRLSLLYIPTYIFAVWDSYRAAVDLNKHCILAMRENAPVVTFVNSPFGISYLDKRSPYTAAAWCGATPGLGQLMLQRIHHGVFVLFWWIVVVYFSDVLTAVHLTLYGAFTQARDALAPQWFLNIPSLFFFCVYSTYVNSVESNKLFDLEQSQYLGKNYQSPDFPFPGGNPEKMGTDMHIVSIFRQSLQVELAVTALEESGVAKKDIIAVPVEKKLPQRKLFDTMHTYTGDSIFDLAMIMGAMTCLFGCIYGFRLHWGPILWGVIAAAAGFAAGFFIKLLYLKKIKAAAIENDVVILVSCAEDTKEKIANLLRNNGAMGVSLLG